MLCDEKVTLELFLARRAEVYPFQFPDTDPSFRKKVLKRFYNSLFSPDDFTALFAFLKLKPEFIMQIIFIERG